MKLIFLIGTVVAILLPSSSSAEEPVLSGVVIESVTLGSTLEKAGIRPGDVILAWERLPAPPANPNRAAGTLTSIFDWLWLRAEQAPRGPVKVTLERDGQEEQKTIEVGDSLSEVRPRFSNGLAAHYSKGVTLLNRRKHALGFSQFERIGQALKAGGYLELSSWLYLRMAEVLFKTRDWSDALRYATLATTTASTPFARATALEAKAEIFIKNNQFSNARNSLQEAQEIRESIDRDRLGIAATHHQQCTLIARLGDLAIAEEHCRAALDIQRSNAPDSPQHALILNTIGRIAIARGDVAAARELLQIALTISERFGPDNLALATTLTNLGIATRGTSAGESYLLRALDIREKLDPDGQGISDILINLGNLRKAESEFQKAESFYKRALEIRQKLSPESLDVANVVANLGLSYNAKGDSRTARKLLQRALQIAEQLAPDSLFHANTMTNLGLVIESQGNLDLAESYLRRALAIHERLVPNSIALATTLNQLGLIAFARGDLQFAEDCHRRALAIREKLQPGSTRVSSSLNNLGIVALERGDLESAEDFFRTALEIKKAQNDSADAIATVLTNLGLIAAIRGESATAIRHLQSALSLQEKTAPGTLASATILNILGTVAITGGELGSAEQYFERAFRIESLYTPDSLNLARSFHNLGDVKWLRGDIDEARAYWLKALTIKERLSPDSIQVAGILENLAEATPDLPSALKMQRRALTIRQKLSPGSLGQAENEINLAAMLKKAGRLAEAEKYLVHGINSLELQIGRLGGSQDLKAEFRSQRRQYYLRLYDLLLEQGRTAEAFHVLERSRTRGFLAMLAERDLVFSLDIPAPLELRRRRLATEYDRIQRELAESNPKQEPKANAALLEELDEILRKYSEVQTDIKKLSPRLANLSYPVPLELSQAQRSLAPGTLVLYFNVEQESFQVLAISPEDGLEIKTISIGENDLRKSIADFRELIQESANSSRIGILRLTSMESSGRRLFDLLIEPFAERVRRSEHLLIIPDGPLELLPWGALICHQQGSENFPKSPLYLAEWKPLHIAMSITSYLEVRKFRRQEPRKQSPEIEIAAFGEPLYPQTFRSPGQIKEAGLRSAVERGFEFSSLPATRPEVEQILKLYPGEARAYLGSKATEENAKSLPRSTRMVHFATHATLDERFPLNSAVVLSIPDKFEDGKDNGLLQAWEIFERVRIDADLVVLSSCESGLGKEMDGEGLIGLTRAFQYAGARSVIASLWKISDRTTAELMVRFYKHLKTGLPKDEALRAAQMELIRGPIEVKNENGEVEKINASAPYYWAAFQIYGDWQ